MTTDRRAHYYKALPLVRASGFADAIHFQPRAEYRADALYAVIHAIGAAHIGEIDAVTLPALSAERPRTAAVWPSGIGMLADGRMAAIAVTRDDRGQVVELFGVVEGRAPEFERP